MMKSTYTSAVATAAFGVLLLLSLESLFSSASSATAPFEFTIAGNVSMPGVLLGTGYMLLTPNKTVVGNVASWLKLGGRGIDTAKIYADQEGISAAIRQSGVPRSDIFILTKVPGVGPYETIMQDLEDDMAALGGAPLDVVILHWCGGSSSAKAACTTENIHSAWRAMEDFYRAGKARAIVRCVFF